MNKYYEDEQQKDLDDFAMRVTNTGEDHSPDCHCSICEYMDGFEIGIGG